MEFKYLDFDEDIFTAAASGEPNLYVAADDCSSNLNPVRKKHRKLKKPLSRAGEFMNLKRLKDVVFARDEIVLREEKLSVVLFELLTEKEKSRLGIENYNDIIEFSARFHRFYHELNEYQVEAVDITGLDAWQEQRLNLFEDLLGRYEEKLKEEGYTSPIIFRDFANFSTAALDKFERLVFLNVVFFTPFEKKMLKKLDEEIPVKIILQLPEKDFEEDKLHFQGLSLPETWPGRLNIYKLDEDNYQLINSLNLSKPQISEILSPALEDTDYAGVLSPEIVEMERTDEFNSCRIYRFLEALYELLAASPLAEKRLSLPELFSALSRDYFRRYFAVSSAALEKVRELIRDDFVYLSKEMARSELEEALSVFEELEELKELENMPMLVEYLDELEMGILSSPYFSNDVEQFYDALLELTALEDMQLVSSWTDYYTDPALGLLDRFLQYIEFKSIKPALPEGEKEINIGELLGAVQKHREHVVVINASQNWLPSPRGRDFLLTENQRRQSGLPWGEKNRAKQRYRFFRHLLTAAEADVLALENEEENLTPGAFLEELKLEYDLEYADPAVTSDDIPQFYENILSGNKQENGELLPEIENLPENEKDPCLTAQDFPGRGRDYNLSFYKYKTLKNCFFQFFCQHILKIPEEFAGVDVEISPKTYGSMVHIMAEEIMREWKSGGELDVSEDKIRMVVEDIMDDFSLKMDHRFQPYYDKVVRDDLIESLREFFNSPESPLAEEKEFDRVEIEHSVSDKGGSFLETEPVSFYLSGRVDLLLRQDDWGLLIDFKTGGCELEQLDFYELLLRGAAIPGENFRLEKYFYQIVDRRFIKAQPKNRNEFHQNLQQLLQKFVSGGEYTKNQTSQCYNCRYRNICRAVS